MGIDRKIGLYILFALIIGTGLWYSWQKNHGGQPVTGLLSALHEENLFPEPLKKVGEPIGDTSIILAKEVIALTNQERATNQKQLLKENRLLSTAAHNKIQDMIALQYFEHKSPTGKGPADVIEATGYTYVIVGENLAEGDFSDSNDLVQGWMNSPGHRANILNEKFTEIGVAAERGKLNGREVWIAVQEFGRPLSDCPAIDEVLKNKITTNENAIKLLEEQLDQTRAAMDGAKQRGDTETYNRLVPKYNDLADRANALIEDTKVAVSKYNTQVKTFNSCIE